MNVDIKTLVIKVIHQRMALGELQPPEKKILLLGQKVDQYLGVFDGTLPLSIRIALMNLLTQGRIRLDFSDGSIEELELQDATQVMTESDATAAMEVYSAVSTKKTVLGKEITERVVVQPPQRPRKTQFKQ
jgi:hypothetical protein